MASEEVIDEENLEDSSPERIPKLAKIPSLEKQNPARSRQNSMNDPQCVQIIG